jgi:hypothetical protein
MRPHLNHVIFLGAGASYSSGYPIGQNLRLLMASKDHFQAELEKLYPTGNSMLDVSLYESKLKCLQYFDHFSKSVELFRHGGFLQRLMNSANLHLRVTLNVCKT